MPVKRKSDDMNASSESADRASKVQKSPLLPPVFTNGPGTLVTFLIGPPEKPTTFLVHKEFAYHASPILEAAFRSQFIEGQTQTYKLVDTTPRAFRFFMQWVYQCKLTVLETNACGNKASQAFQAADPPYYEKDSAMDFQEVQILALVEAWVLADKLAMPELQDALMHFLYYVYFAHKMIPGLFHYLYRNTSEESPLRKFFLHKVGRQAQDKDLKKFAKEFPHAMLIDLVILRRSYGCVEEGEVEQWPDSDDDDEFYVNTRAERGEIFWIKDYASFQNHIDD